MMSHNDRVDQEAAEWVVQLNDPEADQTRTKQQFLHWLMLAPEHKQAFVQTVDVAYALGVLDRARRIDVQELIRRGSTKVIELDLTGDTTPVPLNAPHPAPQPP